MASIQDVTVVGAGLMGHAIALVHAAGGCNVCMQDVNPETLERAPGLVEGAVETLVRAGKITSEAGARAISRISTEPDLGRAVDGAELIVEAVVEVPDVKRDVYAKLDAMTGVDVIVASNTSHLDVFPLVPERRQSRTLIAHWYSPPYIVDLVDLAPGPSTDPEIIEQIRVLYAGFGKEPVVFEQLIPGYIANRLQAAIGLECFRLLDECGVSAEDIDRSIRHGLALRFALMGHMKKSDFAGLELIQRSLANAVYSPPVPSGRSDTLDRLVEQGRTGAMAGAGFFDYEGKSPRELFRQRDEELIALDRALRAIEGERD